MQSFTCFVSAFRRHTRGRDCEAESPSRPSCATEQEIAFLRNLVAPSPSSCGIAAHPGLRTLNFEPQGSEATELSSAICGDCASEKWEEELLGDCHHLLEAFPFIEVEANGNEDREDIGNRCRPPDANRSNEIGDNEH